MGCISNCFYCQHDCIYEALEVDRVIYKRQRDKVIKRNKAKEKKDEIIRNRREDTEPCR